MIWNPFRGKDSSKDEPDNKRKLDKLDQNEPAPVKLTGGIRQARLSRLNTGEQYRLTISNHLKAKIIGGKMGSFRVTGESVIIQDLNSNTVFSGELGDRITVKDENGVTTAIAEVGAGSRTDSFVEIKNANLYETIYKFSRAPQVVVENLPLPVQRTQSVKIKLPAQIPVPLQTQIPSQVAIPSQIAIPIGMEMEMNANQMAQNMNATNVSPNWATVPTGMTLNGNESSLARGATQTPELLQSGPTVQQDLDDLHARFLDVYNKLSATAKDEADKQSQEAQLGQEEDPDENEEQSGSNSMADIYS